MGEVVRRVRNATFGCLDGVEGVVGCFRGMNVLDVFLCFERTIADSLERIQMGEGSGCTVRKTTAGKKSLRMTGSGSMGAKTTGPRRSRFSKSLEIQIVPGK